MKRFAWAASGLAVTFLTLAMLSGNGEPVQAQLPAPRPNRAPLTSRTAGVIEATDCSIMLIDVAILAAERPGIIATCDLEAGDPVFVGKPVARLKDGVAVAARATAEFKATNDINEKYQSLAWDVAEKELDIAEDANRRLPGTVPLLEIQKLSLAAKRGELALRQAEFERETNRKLLTEATEQLKTYVVLAPFDGIVSRVHRHPGEAVTQGAPILEIISTARMKIEGYVSIVDSFDITKGDPVIIRVIIDGVDLAIEREDIRGKIVLVAPEIEPLLKMVKVTAHVEINENGILKEGLSARMVIQPRRLKKTAALPRR